MDKFQILRDFANSNEKPDRTIYQYIKEILDLNSAYAKQLKKKDEVINRLKKLNLIINDSDYVYSQDEITSKNLELLSILEDKEVE